MNEEEQNEEIDAKMIIFGIAAALFLGLQLIKMM